MNPSTRNILRREGTPNPDSVGRIDLNVEQYHSGADPKQIIVTLYNYGVDGNLPRDEHKAWLKSTLAPFARQHRYHLKLLGQASQMGSYEANQRVATERILLLKEFLVEQCQLSEAMVPGNEMRVLGSQRANGFDSQKDRAVQVVLSPGWKTLPNPPPPPEPDPVWPEWDPDDYYSQPHDPPDYKPDKPRQRYRVRYLGGYGGSFMYGREWHRFEILDVASGKTKRFRMSGHAIGIGAHYTPPPPNPGWSDAFTSNSQSLDDFSGRTTFMGSGGIAAASVTKLSILGCDPVDLDTGMSLGVDRVPFSANAGELEIDR